MFYCLKRLVLSKDFILFSFIVLICVLSESEANHHDVSGYGILGRLIKSGEVLEPKEYPCFYGMGFKSDKCQHNNSDADAPWYDLGPSTPSGPFHWESKFGDAQAYCLECCSSTRLGSWENPSFYNYDEEWVLDCDSEKEGSSFADAEYYRTFTDFRKKPLLYEFRFMHRQTFNLGTAVGTRRECFEGNTSFAMQDHNDYTAKLGGEALDQNAGPICCPLQFPHTDSGMVNPIDPDYIPKNEYDQKWQEKYEVIGYNVTVLVEEYRAGFDYWRGVNHCEAHLILSEKGKAAFTGFRERIRLRVNPGNIIQPGRLFLCLSIFMSVILQYVVK